MINSVYTAFLNVMLWLRKERVLKSIPEEEVLEKQRFVVFRIFSVTAILVCIAVALKMLLTLKSNWLPYSVLTTGGVILINYLLIGLKTRLERAYIIMLISCLILLHIVAYTCGGIRTGGTFFLTAVIIYAFMLLGRKGGWAITAAAGVHVLILFFLSSYTDLTSFSLFEEKVQLINEDFLVNIFLTFLLIAALSSYLQSGRNVVIQRIVETNKQLAENNRLLAVQNAALEKKNEELDKFASLASHDLRSPLRAIGSLSDMILEDDMMLHPESLSKLNLIRQRAHRMDKLLSALLEYARAGNNSASIGEVDLNALFLGLKVKHQHNESIEIHTRFEIERLVTPGGQLEKVFDILLDNAIRFNDKKEVIIQVDGKREGAHFSFCVSDNGPGIPEAFHDKVFVIFQTLAARDTVETSGAGLAIAKKIVQEQGGQIHIISDSKESGCKVRFTWPGSSNQTDEVA